MPTYVSFKTAASHTASMCDARERCVPTASKTMELKEERDARFVCIKAIYVSSGREY